MILEIFTTEVNMLLGVGLMLGIPLLLTYFDKGDLKEYLVWVMIINAFVVEAHMLPVFSFIMSFSLIIMIISLDIYHKYKGNDNIQIGGGNEI